MAAPAAMVQGRRKEAGDLQHQLVLPGGGQQRRGLPVPAQPAGQAQARW